jgi:hypothetical protein
VCPACAYKLNYKKERQYRKAAKRRPGAREEGGGDGEGAGAKRARQDEGEGGAAAGAGEEEQPAYGVKPPPARAEAQQEQQAAVQQAAQQASVLPGDESVWERKPAVEVPSLEDELDEYLEGMFV